MKQYEIGSNILVTSLSSGGNGYFIIEYEWKLDDVLVPGTSGLSEISIDTTELTAGIYLISLKVKNDCGEWSNINTQQIKLVEEEKEVSNIEKYILWGGILTLGMIKILKK